MVVIMKRVREPPKCRIYYVETKMQFRRSNKIMAREIFCPLVNGECKDNCIFNNGCGDYPGDSVRCNLQDAVGTIQQWGVDSINNDGLNGIMKKLDEIKSDIPDNYTYQINSTLDDIHRELLKITKQNE